MVKGSNNNILDNQTIKEFLAAYEKYIKTSRRVRKDVKKLGDELRKENGKIHHVKHS